MLWQDCNVEIDRVSGRIMVLITGGNLVGQGSFGHHESDICATLDESSTLSFITVSRDDNPDPNRPGQARTPRSGPT